DEHHAALDFLGNVVHGRADDNELVAPGAVLIDIPKPAAGLRGLPQRFVKILQVENAGAVVGDDKVQRVASGFGCRRGRVAVAVHLFGNAPGPDRHGRIGMQTFAYITQNLGHALLFRGADICQWSARLEDLADSLSGSALDGAAPVESSL